MRETWAYEARVRALRERLRMNKGCMERDVPGFFALGPPDHDTEVSY